MINVLLAHVRLTNFAVLLLHAIRQILVRISQLNAAAAAAGGGIHCICKNNEKIQFEIQPNLWPVK